MKNFKGRTAVLTGAASGFGLEVARIAAARGMNVVMADVQKDALDKAVAEIESLGAKVLPFQCDVSKGEQIEAMARATVDNFGAPNFVFNNAGVGGGGLMWEATPKDWEWVLGVNLMGVVHGVRAFTPLMLEAEKKDPDFEGHIINTASMAGMVCAPNMSTYNVSKHAVVALTETLYQDLALVSDRVTASLLCPYFVPTGIHISERNRPDAMASDKPMTKSQVIGHATSAKAVNSGKVSAAEVAQFVFDAIEAKQFYIWSHPQAISGIQARMDDILNTRNPSNPFFARPEMWEQLRKALRETE
jgi:NAD(P)-dependent dehydrogenase (short-subunit alcohol dehydrogenase family)